MPWGKHKTEETIQCSLVGALTVYLEPTPRQKIALLMNEYRNQEWLAYMKGKLSEKSNICVEDIVVPPHKEAGGATAEAEPFHVPEDCVGIIHSHHSMGAFHSGTDQSYVDKNYPVSLTVARNGSGELVFDAVSYSRTPCGKNVTLKSVVKYVQPKPLFDQGRFLSKAKDNIDKANNRKPLYTPSAEKEASYVPVRYRMPSVDRPYITDATGRVLTDTELKGILKTIYKE